MYNICKTYFLAKGGRDLRNSPKHKKPTYVLENLAFDINFITHSAKKKKKQNLHNNSLGLNATDELGVSSCSWFFFFFF